MNKSDFTKSITANGQSYTVYSLEKLQEAGIGNIERLPFSIRILVENLLRNFDGKVVTEEHVKNIANWQKKYETPVEIPHHPARVIMQDFTGVPGVVDLAAMRDAAKELGIDPKKVNPLVPVDLVIDHSVQIDFFGSEDAYKKNLELEYKRNKERYLLLKWAQNAFDNLRIFPPGSGIIHQVNLEYIAQVVMTNNGVAFPDSLVGTDSHTTMINGLGVLGWGVGGIEAEAVMLGQPYYMKIPEVVGVKLTGELPEGATTTDLVLTITQKLREVGVVEKFVEYFGEGVKKLSLPDRATIANMAPEYGATMGFFPVDEETINFLRLTNRKEAAELAEKYTKENMLFYEGNENPEYSQVIEIDMSKVEPSLAGPSRPQDRVSLKDMKKTFIDLLNCNYNREIDVKEITAFEDEAGKDMEVGECRVHKGKKIAKVEIDGKEVVIGDGSVVIASITSCTNTSNPSVLIGAGLLAKKAVEKGLNVKPYVKTSLAPGSRVVEGYLKKAGLLPYLEALRFHIVGFGCTTCIGNSGPLNPEIEKAIKENDLIVSAVLSGNRNFEARIHSDVKANWLASPILVVAYAIAGRTDIDLTTEPIGKDPNGNPVYLKDIWPSQEEINEILNSVLTAEVFEEKYKDVLKGDEYWQSLEAPTGEIFQWDANSTYVRKPPYFDGFTIDVNPPKDITGARVLELLGDSVTTDHISPAGKIPADYPAGKYLLEHGVPVEEFNSYGSRRGNHEVMVRGTFANVRIKNKLVAPKEGGYTLKLPEKEEMFVYDAAVKYEQEGTPLIVLGGKEYGTGSSRDWAAKGTQLLGVKAVIVKSFERIHRSNLVGMGVLPLQFKEGEGWEELGLDGTEVYEIFGIEDIAPGKELKVRATKENGEAVEFNVITRLDTIVDIEYFKNGGILPLVLRKIATA
ncbi:aconitate hydratase AcnA [Hydrogenivirga sp. 128-5-R1-1]|uniref:aconitate hydratase AcnA n=1 Tax=Hydrogenivirga sp. 128-5-R1-1 TaxID=392423 RepID=UPI00015F1516|nr:aconitate hydratase AcnA [Hydrogenivirga sp. 128-5-R1-1]EDP74263.1 aconitate hydratase [Hydrogenivirga sp. 128-5-R1-1]